jgi:hypothetical protein
MLSPISPFFRDHVPNTHSKHSATKNTSSHILDTSTSQLSNIFPLLFSIWQTHEIPVAQEISRKNDLKSRRFEDERESNQ